MLNRHWLWAVPAGALLVFSLAQAQDAQQQQGRRGRGNFDPAQMRQRMEDRMKEQLGVSADEWKVLQPKLEKVMTARRDTMGGFGFGGRGGRNRGADQGAQPSDRQESKVAKAQNELRTTLDNSSASSAEIDAKLKALRSAREQARKDLAAAQRDLKEVCTPRQEAVLVLDGWLE
jgi:hypothetical protein